MTLNRIAIKSSNSPLGGGSVRVYVGDSLVWTKRVTSLQELVIAEQEVRLVIANKRKLTEPEVPNKQSLRLVK